ncbi:MAG: carbohydrate deacetylase [Bacillota bacterium]
MHYLIVNADDLGLAPGVTRGILEAHARGVVTSASAMANMPGFQDAMQAASDHPELGIGVHLTLTAGRPVLSPSEVPTLVDRPGRFIRRPLRQCLFGSEQDVHREWDAQIRAFLATGISPTHLDSHHNLHLYPPYLDIACRLAEKHGIFALRVVRPDDQPVRRTRGPLRYWYMALLRHSLARASQSALEFPDRTEDLTGGTDTGPLHARFEAFLATTARERGIAELACHPGYCDDRLAAISSLCPEREADLAMLCSERTRDALEHSGVKLVSFGIFRELHSANWLGRK